MSEKPRVPGVDFSDEEKGQLPPNSTDFDLIIDENDRNVETASRPQLHRELSVTYRTLYENFLFSQNY
jgi:hypothetical protein